ncbi:MAG TPA: hypothetical protein PLK57_05535 [Clostridiales bacterium]|nr:hypothetical protein [Clostridiales bacterium]HXK84047.1 hypothetical protein [Clostridiales bacterium]
MRRYKRDASCAKPILKKSGGYLRISIMFLVSVVITSIIGLLYARQYFQFEKDFLTNIALRTFVVDANYGENRIGRLNQEDVEQISRLLKEKFPNEEFSVIPVYRNSAVSLFGRYVRLYGIDPKHSFIIGLENMEDNVLYTVSNMQDTVPLEISVVKIEENGFEAGENHTKSMKTSTGVSKNSPVLSDDLMRDSDMEYCFVTTKTFEEIVPIIVDGKANSIQEALNLPEALVRMHIYVIAENSFKLRPVYLFLSDHNYNGLAKIDIFEDFAETISVSFFVFSLSALVLLIMTTVNIILSFRSFYRVQQKDMAF